MGSPLGPPLGQLELEQLGKTIARQLKCARECSRSLLRNILQQPRAQEAFDGLLRRGCDRAFLECYLTEPVEPHSLTDNAESRKTDLNLAKSFLGSLQKTLKLANEFSRFSGEPFHELRHALAEARFRVTAWAKRPRPVALFTLRQHQQFRLLERIHHETGMRHYREAATLLGAVYAHSGIRKHPDEESLKHLVKRFKENQARRP
jgi:hypothetical protein